MVLLAHLAKETPTSIPGRNGKVCSGMAGRQGGCRTSPFSSHLSMAGTHRATAETGVSSSLLCLGSISQLSVLFMARRSAAATVGCWPCPGVRVPVAFQATVWISAPLLPGWVTFSHCLSCRIHSDISPPPPVSCPGHLALFPTLPRSTGPACIATIMTPIGTQAGALPSFPVPA